MRKYYHYYRTAILKNTDRDKLNVIMEMAKEDLDKKNLKQNEYELLLKVRKMTTL